MGREDDWAVIATELSPEALDAVCNFLHETGSVGLEQEDTDAGVTVTAYFRQADAQDALKALENYLTDLDALMPNCVRKPPTGASIVTEEWAVMWKENFHTLEIGRRLIVTPPWLPVKSDLREVIIIEPAEAFGTGSHETTQGCLELLERALADHSSATVPASVLDLGTGSGILAIAAVKLGAHPVLGVDNDIAATLSAQKNAELNGLDDMPAFRHCSLTDITDQYDIVTANLDLNTFRRYIDHVAQVARGRIIISGLTTPQWPEIRGEFLRRNFVLEHEFVTPEWMAGLFVRSSSEAGGNLEKRRNRR